MRKAEAILREAVTYTSRPVHAYQLFSPADGPMSPKAVEKRFKEMGWKSLSHNVLFEKVIKPLLAEVSPVVEKEVKAFNVFLEAIGENKFQVEGIQNRLHSVLQTFFEDERIDELVGDVTELVWKTGGVITESISEQLRKRSDGYDVPDLSKLDEARGFLGHVADWYPDGGSQMVRPYELFLFAAQQNLLKEHLIINGSEPSTGAVVNSWEPQASILYMWKNSAD